MSGADTGAAVETMEPYAVFHSFHSDRLGLFSGTVFWVGVCPPPQFLMMGKNKQYRLCPCKPVVR